MASPSSLAELNPMLKEIEPDRLARLSWLSDRLYHELSDVED
ncbi:MAG: hypothetical protein WCW68_13460 [Methanothrix sp.]|jgi:hypothetical protein